MIQINSVKLPAALLFLFLAAFVVRFAALPEAPIFADELLWESRSLTAIEKLRSDPFHYAEHLSHPGVPPAIVMGVARKLAEKWNSVRGLGQADPQYVWPMESCRMASALAGALTVPILFLLELSVFSFGVALFSAGLFALDPFHIACSIMAHLDVYLTLSVVGCIALYVFAERNQLLVLKLAAGVLWGGSILTKPTAFFVPFALLGFRLCRFCSRAGNTVCSDTPRRWVGWDDVWTLLLGSAVFCASYSRMWYHESAYLNRLHIRNSLAGMSWRIGRFLGNYPVISTLTILALVGISIWMFQSQRAQRYRNIGHILALGSIVLAAELLVPQVVENYVRYWTWAGGLSDAVNVTLTAGTLVQPPMLRYLGAALAHFPDLVLIGLFAGFLALARRLVQRQFDDRTAVLLLAAVSVTLLLSFLSVSPKESWRYALPIVPLAYLLAGYGLYLLGCLLARATSVWPLRYLPFAASLIVAIAICVTQTPDYFFFRSRLSGGIPGSLRRYRHLENFGNRRIVSFLYNATRTLEPPIKIDVLGDGEVLRVAFRRFFPEAGHRLMFGRFDRKSARFLLRFQPFGWTKQTEQKRYQISATPVYVYAVGGTPIVEIYEYVRRSFKAPPVS